MKRLLILLILISCSSPKKATNYHVKFRKLIKEQQCSSAQKVIPLEKDETKALRFYKGTIGYVGSLSVMGATVMLDVILMMRCRYGCNERDRTFLETLFPTTSFTYEHTKDMRCPDNSYYVNKLIEVAECYERKDTFKDDEEALSLLRFLRKQSETSATCVKKSDRKVVLSNIWRIEEKIEFGTGRKE